MRRLTWRIADCGLRINVVDMIEEGVMIGTGSQRAAEIGRAFTKRTIRW